VLIIESICVFIIIIQFNTFAEDASILFGSFESRKGDGFEAWSSPFIYYRLWVNSYWFEKPQWYWSNVISYVQWASQSTRTRCKIALQWRKTVMHTYSIDLDLFWLVLVHCYGGSLYHKTQGIEDSSCWMEWQ